MRACDRIYRDLQVKCRGPEAGPALCASLHKVESRSTFHKSHFTRKFTGKMSRPRSGTRTLCEPARPKFMSTFHKRLYTEIDRKNAAAQIEPRTQTHTLCEPAQSKCRSTFHKSHFIRKFTVQEKCRGSAGAPWSSTGLYTYCKKPSVSTHCLGKNHVTFLSSTTCVFGEKTTLPIPSRCQISLGKADAVSLHAEVGHCSGSLQCLDSCCQ